MTPRDEDRWVGDALQEAVADVEPRHDLDDIRARIEEDAMRTSTRTRWAAAAAGVAVAATVATVAYAAGLGAGDDPGTGPVASSSDAPSATTGATEGSDAASPSPAASSPVAVYYLGDTPTGPRLFREFRAPEGDGDALAVAVAMATSVTPLDPDYRSPWPDGAGATASYDGDLLTVDVQSAGADLRARPAAMSADEARMALEQLMYTAQAVVQSRPPVRFLTDGEVTDKLLGVPVSEPLTQGDPMQVQGPVWVITPQEADEVSGSLAVEGRGSFFEANVSWQVLREGDVVAEGYATAEECCTLSPFSFEVADLPPGGYVLRVYDADMSDGEGPGEQEDTKRFTVTG
jgi:hypothetical protein